MNATWLDAIDANGFDGWTRQMLVTEAQRTRFPGDLPPGFGFLRGAFADLGFDRLGLTRGELDAVLGAFVGAGLAVPGSACRLRLVRPVQAVVEPADGGEAATLPTHWREGVVVVGSVGTLTWIGKREPRERLTGFDPRGYADAGDGWVPMPNSGDGGDGHD